MTRDEVFAALTALGVTKAVLEFSGGGDEGNVDSFSLYAQDKELAIEVDSKLAEALEEPIYDKYGGFDGGFDVRGELTWDVAARKVKLVGAETEWVDFEEEVPEVIPEEIPEDSPEETS